MIKARFMRVYIIPYRQIIVTELLIEFKSNVEIPFLSIWKNIRCFKPILNIYCLPRAEEQYVRLHISKLFCTYSALLATELILYSVVHTKRSGTKCWIRPPSWIERNLRAQAASFGKVTAGLFLYLVNFLL